MWGEFLSHKRRIKIENESGEETVILKWNTRSLFLYYIIKYVVCHNQPIYAHCLSKAETLMQYEKGIKKIAICIRRG